MIARLGGLELDLFHVEAVQQVPRDRVLREKVIKAFEPSGSKLEPRNDTRAPSTIPPVSGAFLRKSAHVPANDERELLLARAELQRGERAKAQQALAEWAEVLNAAGQVAADEATRQLLTDPGLAEQKKADVILDCTGKSVSEEQRNFLTILADNRRLALLPEIATLFNSFRADLERTIDINVSSAFELTAEQQQKLAEALSRKLDRNVQIEAAVDKSLIGGLVVRTGDLVIDASVRGKLTKLAESLGS